MDTISIIIITMGYNSINLKQFLYQVSCKNLERFRSYGADTISILINTKGHDSVKTIRVVTVVVL